LEGFYAQCSKPDFKQELVIHDRGRIGLWRDFGLRNDSIESVDK
jgi:hypothetical protein